MRWDCQWNHLAQLPWLSMQTVPHLDETIISNYGACSRFLTSQVIVLQPNRYNKLSYTWKVFNNNLHQPHLKHDPDLTLWRLFVLFTVFGLRVSPHKEAAISVRQQVDDGEKHFPLLTSGFWVCLPQTFTHDKHLHFFILCFLTNHHLFHITRLALEPLKLWTGDAILDYLLIYACFTKPQKQKTSDNACRAELSPPTENAKKSN